MNDDNNQISDKKVIELLISKKILYIPKDFTTRTILDILIIAGYARTEVTQVHGRVVTRVELLKPFLLVQESGKTVKYVKPY